MATNNNEGVYRVFRCPSDTGAKAGRWPLDELPTIFDVWGISYRYSSGAQNNDGKFGFWNKKSTEVRHPTAELLAYGEPFDLYSSNWLGAWPLPVLYSRWHNPKQLPAGSPLILKKSGKIQTLKCGGET